MKQAKYVTLVSYWVVGIPLSYVLMFKADMSCEGLWYGPTAACLLNYVFYEYYIRRADWQQIADNTIAKLNKDSAKNSFKSKTAIN